MISHTKQVFAFQGLEHWNIVAAMLTILIGLGETGPRRNGRMEQNFPVIPIFRNIGTSSRGTPKIRNEIPENALSIRSSPGINISGIIIFGRMESAPCDQKKRRLWGRE